MAAAAAPRQRRKASSASKAASSSVCLDKDGVPNEGVLQAIEALGYTCAVHDVVAHCGLPRDLVEAEMAALLRASNGFFEIASSTSANDDQQQQQHKELEYAANVFSTDHVRYVFPPGLRSLLRRRFVLIRMRDAGAKVLGFAFAILRVSFGLLLLLSLLVVMVVLVVVMARSGGGDHRHGPGLDVLRIFHRPRRHYVGGGGLGGGGGDWRDMYYMWWWWNYNPFLFGLDPQIQAQRFREQQQRRRRAFDALDEEEGGREGGRGGGGGGGGVPAGTRRRAGSSSSSTSHRLARLTAEGYEEEEHPEQSLEGGGGEEEGEEVEDMTFLEAVFSLLFGDGSPGPSQNQRWQVVAKLIHTQGGIVLPEEVVPLLTEVDPQEIDRSMLPVCARFGGRPVRCVDGKTGRDCGYLYDFARMREGERKSTLLVPTVVEREGGREEGEEATAGLLREGGGEGGMVVVEMTRVDKRGEETLPTTEDGDEDEDERFSSSSFSSSCSSSSSSFSSSSSSSSPGYLIERRYVFSRAPLHLLQLSGALGLINLVGAIWVSDQWVLFPEPGSTVLYVVGRALLWYAALYLLLPLSRLVIIAYWNRGIHKRNAVRKKLWKEWRQAQMGQGGGEGGREGGRAGL